jgi:hypothetical protein
VSVLAPVALFSYSALPPFPLPAAAASGAIFHSTARVLIVATTPSYLIPEH